MKEKISITLSKDIIAQVNRLAGFKESRSAFIERVLRRYMRERGRSALNASDLQRINRAAARLNKEVADVLEYQAFVLDKSAKSGPRRLNNLEWWRRMKR